MAAMAKRTNDLARLGRAMRDLRTLLRERHFLAVPNISPTTPYRLVFSLHKDYCHCIEQSWLSVCAIAERHGVEVEFRPPRGHSEIGDIIFTSRHYHE